MTTPLILNAQGRVWRDLGALSVGNIGYADIVYVDGLYYLFSSVLGNFDSCVLRVADTPEGLVGATPLLAIDPVTRSILSSAGTGTVVFTTSGPSYITTGQQVMITDHPAFDGQGQWLTARYVALNKFSLPGNSSGGGAVGAVVKHLAVRYPTVVYEADASLWHMWAYSVPDHDMVHMTSTDPGSYWNRQAVGVFAPFVTNDNWTRYNSANDKWYSVCLMRGDNYPVMLFRADSPDGPWTNMGSVWADIGTPPWSLVAQPDPNLAFTPDGRCFLLWVAWDGAVHRVSLVEMDVDTGKAIGTPVCLAENSGLGSPAYLAVDGEPERVFAFAGAHAYCLDLTERV